MLKRCLSVFALAAFVAVSGFTHKAKSQDIPAATRGGQIQVGLAYSTSNTDYYQKNIGGFTLWGDMDFTKHWSGEAEAHILQFQTPNDFAMRSYVFGPRYSLRHTRYDIYAKGIIGLGQLIAQAKYVETPEIPGSSIVFGAGAGLDIKVNRKFTVRAVDFEYQDWPNFDPNGVTPTVLSFGIAYRIR